MEVQGWARVLEGVREARTRDECGAAMIEYGMLITFIGVVALIGVTAFGQEVLSIFPNFP